MPPRLRTRLLGATIALALTVPLGGCGYLFVTEGDDFARQGAEAVAAQIGSRTDNTAGVSLEEMVAWWVPADPVTTADGWATVDALAWSGRIGDDSEATIDVRIHVEVEAASPSALGLSSHGAGEATACYRLVWPRYDEARRSEIPCPDGPAPARPAVPPRPELTDEDTARVTEILATTPDPTEIEPALRRAFPREYHRIETDQWKGETVVAVGIPAERECILVVRDAAGDLSYPSYRRVSLEPGELGCSTALYTNPPL